MRIGVFADTHDHLDHLRRAVDCFNQWQCALVIFAGDLVSTFAVPPLRKLDCPIIACFGDNEGNKTGIRGGFEVLGEIAEPPVGFQTADGTRILLTHQKELLRGDIASADVVIFAHTHRAAISREIGGPLLINPGETSGWSFGKPTVAILTTDPLQAEIVPLWAPP